MSSSLSQSPRSTEPWRPALLSGQQPTKNQEREQEKDQHKPLKLVTNNMYDKPFGLPKQTAANQSVPLANYQHIRASPQSDKSEGSPLVWQDYHQPNSEYDELACDDSSDEDTIDNMNDYRPASPPATSPVSSTRARTGSLPLYFGERPPVPYPTQRLTSFTYGMPIAPCICNKHHHRRSSVAIKFKNTYLDEYHDPDLIIMCGDHHDSIVPADSHLQGSLHMDEARRGLIKRPPSPIAERILKGEIDNM